LAGDGIEADIVRDAHIDVPMPDDPRLNWDVEKHFGLNNLARVFVPLQAPLRNEVLGTICAGYNRTTRQFIYERDVQTLKRLADFALVNLQSRRVGVIDRISHEINAPLAAVRNNLSRLIRRGNTLSRDRTERIFEDMVTDIELVHYQILQLEQALGGRGSPTVRRPLNVETVLLFRDIIFKTINQLRGMVSDKGLDPGRVTYEPEDVYKVGALSADKSRISQVIFNLFVNAVKYSRNAETFRIHIGAEERPHYYVIKFSDWGIGVPDGWEEKIFDEGVRAPVALAQNVAGSGLGLTIARRLMREHQGELILSNKSNPTQFEVIIPKQLREHDENFVHRR